jgi:hypothetical protein
MVLDSIDVPISTARMLREGLWTLLDQKYISPTEYSILAHYTPGTATMSVVVYHGTTLVAEYTAD